MTILKSLQNWESRIEKLKEKDGNNIILTDEVKEVERNIFEIYRIIFKNLVIKRIETDIEKGENQSNYKWCLNKEGFSFLYRHGYNSDYIGNFNQLLDVLSKHKELLKYLTKPNKKKLIKIWGKEFDKLKEKEFNFNLKLKEKKALKQINEEDMEIIKLEYKSNEVSFFVDEREYRSEEFNFVRLKTDDYIMIEQFYSQINKILDNYKNKMLKMRKERDRLLVNLRGQFSSELILEELKKEK